MGSYMNKAIEYFESELGAIPDADIREWTARALQYAPDEFMLMPASLSGKYHPEDERGECGKALHTKRAFRTLLTLFDSYGAFTDEAKSLCMSAILLHDVCYNEQTGKYHPLAVRPYYRVKLGRRFVNEYSTIFDIIEAHSGKWSVFDTLRPNSPEESIVHLADNIAAKLHILLNGSDENGAVA